MTAYFDHLKQVVDALLSMTAASQSDNGPKSYSRLLANLRRASLCETVTFEPFQKFPYTRHPLNMTRERIAGDADHRAHCAGVIATNLKDLLVRELSFHSEIILTKLSASVLDAALEKLWVSKFTGDNLAVMVLEEILEPGVAESFAPADASLQKASERIERIIARNSAEFARKEERRIEQQLKESASGLDSIARMAAELVDARFEILEREMARRFGK